MAIQFKPGDSVSLTISRQNGVVVEGPNRKNQFLVAVGSLRIWVLASELKAAKEKKAKDLKKHRRSRDLSTATSTSSNLDLHGCTRQEAVERLEKALDQALLHGTSEIVVVHGLGTGAVKSAVHDFLSESKHVSAFKIDESNPGVTRVFI